jgi:hypothetical protein
MPRKIIAEFTLPDDILDPNETVEMTREAIISGRLPVADLTDPIMKDSGITYRINVFDSVKED